MVFTAPPSQNYQEVE